MVGQIKQRLGPFGYCAPLKEKSVYQEALMMSFSMAGLSATICAASAGFILRLIQLSTRTTPEGRSSIFLDASKSKWTGLTMVIDLHDTAFVRIFSPNTKNGMGKLISLSKWKYKICHPCR